MKGSSLQSGALRAIGRMGRRRLCTSQPGAAAAAAWAELQDEARAALSTPAYARFGMDRFLFGEVLTHGSLAEALAHELGSKFTANDTDKQVRFEELLLHAFTEDPTLADAAAADMRRFVEVDPASDGILDVLLFFKGFQAVQCARAASQPCPGWRATSSTFLASANPRFASFASRLYSCVSRRNSGVAIAS